MLTYQETIWREKNGYKTRKVQLRFEYIQASQTVKEQRARIEKLSLVVFLDKDQKKILMNAGRRLKRNDRDFYQNRNLHVTVLGFGPLAKTSYEPIQRKIQEFSRKKRAAKLTVTLNTIRPGTIYSNDGRVNPISGLSNGTVVALGDVKSNKEFYSYSNRLASFLLNDKKIKSVLGTTFGKSFLRFGALWDIMISEAELGSLKTLKCSLKNTITWMKTHLGFLSLKFLWLDPGTKI